MNGRPLFKCGAAGSVVTAVCCFTPVLAVLLPAVGLAAWLGWADYVLLPALAAFLGLTAYAWGRMRREREAAPAEKQVGSQQRADAGFE